MRGRRSRRSAAVVLAGCVGLAVMAPGLALAAAPPATNQDCVDEYGPGSVLSSATATGCTEPTGAGATGTGTTGTGTTGSDTTGTDTTGSGTTGSGTTGSDTTGSGTGTGTTGTGTNSTDTNSADTTGATGGTPAAGTGQQDTAGETPATVRTPEQIAAAARNDPSSAAPSETPAEPATNEVMAVGADQLTAQLAALPILGDFEVPEGFVPGGGNIPLDLPFDVPTAVPAGGFTNPQEACAFLVGGLNAAPSQLAALGEGFSQFCTSLPTSFTDFDPTTLIGDLLGLLQGLIDAFPTPGAIPNQPPAYVPADYWGYWHKQYDVDCPELTYDEANAILAWDRSDPFRLDRDRDGEACENNRHDDDVEYVVYDSYPVGGVATGDGSTDSGASGAEVALAAGALSGLGVTGLALVRRFARQG